MYKKLMLALIALLFIQMFASSVGTLATTTAGDPIKIGVIGPKYLPQWGGGINGHGGMIDGAILAQEEINAAGGINIGGTTHNIELYPADEHAYNPATGTYDSAAAVTEVTALLGNNLNAIVGGFRTETTAPIIETVMDYDQENPSTAVPFLIAGASTNELIHNLTDPATYERYKWDFRVMPVNGTILFSELMGYLKYWLIPQKLVKMYGTVKYAVVAEDLTWADQIVAYLSYPGILGPNATLVHTFRAPVTTTSFKDQLDQIEAKGAHLVIDIFTLPLAPILISEVNAYQKKMLVCGIDVFGQLQTNWASTKGGCSYEIMLNWAGTRTPVVPGVSDVFWDSFLARWNGSWPIYTAVGAYEAIYLLKEAYERAGTTDPSALLPALEATNQIQVGGRFIFTPWHDFYSQSVGPTWTDGYARSMVVQWIANATAPIGAQMNVVCPVDQLYSLKTLIPPVMYDLAPYDLNFDGKINIADISLAAIAFAASPGNPRWNMEADVDVNGVVNIVDIAKMAGQFSKTAPQWPLP